MSDKLYECPECHGDELAFEFTMVGTAYVNAAGDVTDDRPGDMEWTGQSPARCKDCGFAGTVEDFDAEPLASSRDLVAAVRRVRHILERERNLGAPGGVQKGLCADAVAALAAVEADAKLAEGYDASAGEA